jgi:hypothetical protein
MALQQAMAGIRVGEAMVYGGLAVFPLFGDGGRTRNYLTLHEAFQKEGVRISEVSERGSVPELRFKNLLGTDIFAADGETLIGAKQNRVLNSSIYVKAHDEIVIPVSCVEQGRWSYRKRNFQASDLSEFVGSRAAKMASVASSLRMTGTDRRSNQRAVWSEVDMKCADFSADAPTRSMDDAYKAARPSLDEYLKHMHLRPDQIGMAVAIDGKTAGIEFFEDPTVFAQFFDKLMRAYAAEVVMQDRIATVVPDKHALEHLLFRIGKARCETYDAVGSGREVRFELDRMNGSALEVDNRLLHFVLLGSRRRTRHCYRAVSGRRLCPAHSK